jgi:hypothetical protein
MRTNKRQIGVIAVILLMMPPAAASAEFKDTTVTEDSSDESVIDGTDADGEDSAPVLFEDSSETDEAVIEDTQEQSAGILSLEIEMGTQSVLSGKIPLTVTVTSTIDSNKAAITWDLPRGLAAYGQQEEWFRMEADVPYSFTVEIEPKQSGNYSIVVDVTAWRYDTNYVTSGEFEFQIDEQLHITPAPEAYTRSLMIFRVGVVAGVAAGIVVLIFLVKFGIKRFKTWMAQD